MDMTAMASALQMLMAMAFATHLKLRVAPMEQRATSVQKPQTMMEAVRMLNQATIAPERA
jgi:hypothetical protein